MDYTKLAPKESVDAATKALATNRFEPETVATGADALARVIALIPAGVTVMNGASKTLEQIGYVDYLKEGTHGWKNLHEGILGESDPAEQAKLRKQATLSDFYVGSAHAVTKNGEIVVASASGSQMPHLAHTSPNIILVVSTKKIVPDLMVAFDRLKTQVIPLEDLNMKSKYGPESGTLQAKTLILHAEHPMMGRHVHVIFVEEDLGF
jgi:L-lactate utilization protein LutC